MYHQLHRVLREANVRDEYDVVIGERGSLMEGCWKQQCSPYTYIDKHRNRKRDYELETLDQLDKLARHLEQEVCLEEPEVTV